MAYKNPYQKILVDYLDANGASLSLVANYLGVSERYLTSSYFPTDPEKQGPFPLWLIRQLVLGFNIPFEQFLLSDKELNTYKKRLAQDKGERGKIDSHKYFLNKEQIFTSWSYNASPIKELVRLTNSEDVNFESFNNQYFGTVEKYLISAENRLLIYEFLGKFFHRHTEFYTNYQQVHVNIFNLIETKLDEEKCKEKKWTVLPEYVRILALNDPTADLEFAIRDVIIEVSIPVFEHLCHCLSKYESKAHFYVAPLSRSYHYGIIDNSYLVSEYYKYRYKRNRNLFASPDLMFIEKIDKKEKHQVLFDIYHQEIRDLTSDRSWEITRNKLIYYTPIAKKFLEGKIAKIEWQIKQIINNEDHKLDTFEPLNMESLFSRRGHLENLLNIVNKKEQILNKFFPRKT